MQEAEYNWEWLQNLRKSHSKDVDADLSKYSRIDYVFVEKVLRMRTDLLQLWAQRLLELALNEFDLFLLSLGVVNDHENVARCAKSQRFHLQAPKWLSPEKTVFLQEKYGDLLQSNASGLARHSFEDFSSSTDMQLFIKELLKTRNGQIELGLFLGKGLIARDEELYRLSLDYLMLVMPLHAEFPQVLDAIMAGISSSDYGRCVKTGQTVCSVASKHVNLSEKLAETIMIRIQETFLMELGSKVLNNGLVTSDLYLRLYSNYLPVWLIVLGTCLVTCNGVKSYYKHCDLLLTVPFEAASIQLACRWLCAVINVYTVDPENTLLLKLCARRFSQLIKLEQSDPDNRLQRNNCGPATRHLIEEMTGVKDVGCMYCSQRELSGHLDFSTNILSLLNLEHAEETESEDEYNDADKGKELPNSSISKIALLRITELMETWISSNIFFDGSYIDKLGKKSDFQERALKLAFQYEEQFGQIPLHSSTVLDVKGHRALLASYLFSDDQSQSQLSDFLEKATEAQLKTNQDVLTKVLAKNYHMIRIIVDRFRDSSWAVKTAWSSISTFGNLENLSGILEFLNVTKFIISICVEKKDDTNYQLLLVKNMKLFLSKIDEECLPRLSESFGHDIDMVLSILKCLQSCTRPVHLACSSNKIINPELTSHIPSLKKALEVVLFKVKRILNDNNCLAAFWMGNLKDRSDRGQ